MAAFSFSSFRTSSEQSLSMRFVMGITWSHSGRSMDISMTKTLYCIVNTRKSGSQFLGLVELKYGTGQAIAGSTISLLAKHGLLIANCVGVGSNGASAMVSVHNGMVKHWGLDPGRNVLYQVHCISYAMAVDDIYKDPLCKVYLHEAS